MRNSGLIRSCILTAGTLILLIASSPLGFSQQSLSRQDLSQSQPTALDRQSLSSTQLSSSASSSRLRKTARDIHASAREKVIRVGKKIHHTALDCSHLVHDLYRRAGLTYEYINSEQLYEGTPGFRQVDEPVAGDIIVWHGHMGVVVDPLVHSFLSSLRTGVKVSMYDSNYWKDRGIPRFFRYTADDDVIDLSHQVRVARNHIAHPPVIGD